MKLRQRTFQVGLIREGRWIVAQCLDVDVASRGRTRTEAIRNLKEALALHFQEPVTTSLDLSRNNFMNEIGVNLCETNEGRGNRNRSYGDRDQRSVPHQNL